MTYSASGGLLAHRHGVTLAQSIGDAAIVVHTGVPGVKGMNGNVTTDHWGNAVVTGVRTYGRNNIDIDPASLPETGIARGCALSPLMGALHLYAMDVWFGKQMAPANEQKKTGLYYARYMDDIVILAHSRWQLRKQVRALNRYFNDFGFGQHPDKTFIGRIERGFDWMGAQMSDVGVEGIAHRARVNHIMRWWRLYEQVRRWPAALRRARMSQYRKKWKIWAGCLLLALACVMDASASIGNAADMDAGVRACIANGSLRTAPDGMSWGGTCTIPLRTTTWSPSYIVGSATDGFSGGTSLYASLLLTMPEGGDQRTSNISLLLLGPLTVHGDDSRTWVQWPAGTSFRIGVNTTSTLHEGWLNLPFVNGGVYWQHPNDGAVKSNTGLFGSVDVPVAGADLLWSFAAAPGVKLQYPNLVLSIDGTNATSYGQMSVGVGGNGNVDPTPPNPPITGSPPNCSLITGIPGTSNFGDAVVNAGRGYMTSSKPVPAHAVSLTCSAAGSGSRSATATFYAQSTMIKWTDNATLLASTNDWMGLFFTMPASLPPGVTLAAGQKLNSDLKWNAGNPTPLWTWSLPARATAGAITVPSVSLQPRLYQTGAQGAQFGQRAYTVQYSVVVQ